jgi:hypothetical protein
MPLAWDSLYFFEIPQATCCIALPGRTTVKMKKQIYSTIVPTTSRCINETNNFGIMKELVAYLHWTMHPYGSWTPFYLLSLMHRPSLFNLTSFPKPLARFRSKLTRFGTRAHWKMSLQTKLQTSMLSTPEAMAPPQGGTPHCLHFSDSCKASLHKILPVFTT